MGGRAAEIVLFNKILNQSRPKMYDNDKVFRSRRGKGQKGRRRGGSGLR